jgi:HK97 family phage major capsid protein
MWGLPIVVTQAVNSLEFCVGAFRLGAQVFDRETANVEISTEDDKNFQQNLVTIRAEERLALAVYRPASFITGSFSNLT